MIPHLEVMFVFGVTIILAVFMHQVVNIYFNLSWIFSILVGILSLIISFTITATLTAYVKKKLDERSEVKKDH